MGPGSRHGAAPLAVVAGTPILGHGVGHVALAARFHDREDPASRTTGIPAWEGGVFDVAAAPDGAAWFTAQHRGATGTTAGFGAITTAGGSPPVPDSALTRSAMPAGMAGAGTTR